MKKYFVLILAILISAIFTLNIFAYSGTKSMAVSTSRNDINYTVNAKSAVLMEAQTGEILYAFNEEARYSPASVTKVMTLLIVMESLRDGKITIDENITVSDYAASMGGSQVFLEEGEVMSVKDLIKSTAIASANDAAVALAEHIAGSEKLFVSKMNKRASELGLKNTSFENVTGLDDTTVDHMTCARDIAIMSRELIKHELIKEYSTKWQDTIRNGEFTLTNTNRLVRYYDGCTGLKTGSTDKAGYCLSATAKRGGMELIAVIMGAETRDIRNKEAKALLDFGFANYALYSDEECELPRIPVISGEKSYATLYAAPFTSVINKECIGNVQKTLEIPEELSAPVAENAVFGKIIYTLDNEVIGYSNVYTKESINKASVGKLFSLIINDIFS